MSLDIAAKPVIIFHQLGQALGFLQMLEHQPAFTELAQHRAQLEADFEGLLHRGPAFRQ